MLRVGTILHGTYRIDSYLSSGGFGNTYVATNIEFDERVAIKEFFMRGVTQRDDNQTTVSVSNKVNTNSFLEQREKFKKEARRLRKLKNEHIVAVHDLFEENGTAYYVMDYVDGENLAERLKRTGRPMTENEVNVLLPQILDALKSVHDAGIWHLDLKPANIMVDKAGNVKLIDFGASKQMNAQKGGATTSTAISYTNGYAPREQMEQNYEKFGPWTDIYALGATLYNLLTNKRPPLPSDIDDDMSKDKHLALPMPYSVSDDRKKFVIWLMQTNRLQRPQSINELTNRESTKGAEGSNKKSKDVVSNKVGFDQKESASLEETIITSPKSEETIIEKKPQPKVMYEQKVYPSSAKTEHDTSEANGNSSVWKIILTIAAGIVIILIMNNGGKSCSNSTQPAQETQSIAVSNTPKEKKVEQMGYSTAIGNCQYSGPVDEYNKPNGLGEAYFNDGRYYKGPFEHGTLTGDNCYFKYSNGDEFEGQFRDNSFYYGKYTIAKDKSYYVGYYNNGQPSVGNGTWYDKNGKVIE